MSLNLPGANELKVKCRNISHDIIGNFGWREAATVSLTLFYCNSNLQFRFALTSIITHWLRQNFVHGTTPVLSWHVACTKYCCDLVANNWITKRRIFHRTCISSKRSLVKWARDQRKRIFKMICNHNKTGDFVIQWMWLFVQTLYLS